jgi:hypothetical protein
MLAAVAVIDTTRAISTGSVSQARVNVPPEITHIHPARR